MQDVKLYTQNAPQYEGDYEYRISSILFAIHIHFSGLRSLEFKVLGAENLIVYTGSYLEIEGQLNCWNSVSVFPYSTGWTSSQNLLILADPGCHR